jgi:hypothetical protein
MTEGRGKNPGFDARYGKTDSRSRLFRVRLRSWRESRSEYGGIAVVLVLNRSGFEIHFGERVEGDLVEAAGVELEQGIDNTQVAGFGNG